MKNYDDTRVAADTPSTCVNLSPKIVITPPRAALIPQEWHWPCYRLLRIPDKNRLAHALAANKNPATEILGAFEQFLSILATTFPEDIAVQQRYAANPKVSRAKERLQIYLLASTKSDRSARSFRALVESGPLTRFHELIPSEQPSIPWSRFSSASHIVRHVSAIPATIAREFNPFVPANYCSIRPFKGRRENDLLAIDQICNRIDEHLVIDISVQPADVTPDYVLVSQLLDRYEKVNRTFEDDGDDFAAPRDYLRAENSAFSGWPTRHKFRRRRDPVAQHVAEAWRNFHSSLGMPQLEFRIRVLAETDVNCRLVASLLAEAGFAEGSYRILTVQKSDPYFSETIRCAQECQLSPMPARKNSLDKLDIDTFKLMQRLASLAPVEELASIFRFPLASCGETLCIEKDTEAPALSEEGVLVFGYSPFHTIDGCIDQERSAGRGCSLMTTCKHTTCLGGPGSGKTTAIASALVTFAVEKIPFIVFESAKKEYRSLKTLIDHPDSRVRALATSLAVYTVGSQISPLCLNFCERNSWMTCDDAISDTARCFEGAMAMSAPLPELIREALETVIYEFRDSSRFPTMTDLYDRLISALFRKRYSDSTTSDIRGALDSRIGSLLRGHAGHVFQCRQSCPSIETLAESQSIIELDDLSTEHAALVVMFVLSRVGKYLKCKPWDGTRPRLVIVVEEAHRIVGRDSAAQVSDISANTKAFATETICRMLAEYRALGISVVIVDQLATVLAPQIVKIPCTHIAFSQIDAHEREIVGSAMGLNPMQQEDLGRLNVGECYFRSEGYYEPIKIRTVDPFTRVCK
jgi:hypothetical protein